MISQILGFSVLFILVFGGIIGAVLKFTLLGNVHVNVGNRIPEKRIAGALEQTGAKPNAKSRKASKQSAKMNACKIDDEYSKLQPPA